MIHTGKRALYLSMAQNHEGSITACGTNHAHLHIIPYEKSLLKQMFHDDSVQWIECKITDVERIVQKKSIGFMQKMLLILKMQKDIYI